MPVVGAMTGIFRTGELIRGFGFNFHFTHHYPYLLSASKCHFSTTILTT